MVLERCIVVDSAIDEDVSIGPYAHLRMGTSIGDTARVGNFVEIKKSALGGGTNSMHLAYLGDATIGKNVNIGADVITCNYDGLNKHETIVEERFCGNRLAVDCARPSAKTPTLPPVPPLPRMFLRTHLPSSAAAK